MSSHIHKSTEDPYLTSRWRLTPAATRASAPSAGAPATACPRPPPPARRQPAANWSSSARPAAKATEVAAAVGVMGADELAPDTPPGLLGRPRGHLFARARQLGLGQRVRPDRPRRHLPAAARPARDSGPDLACQFADRNAPPAADGDHHMIVRSPAPRPLPGPAGKTPRRPQAPEQRSSTAAQLRAAAATASRSTPSTTAAARWLLAEGRARS